MKTTLPLITLALAFGITGILSGAGDCVIVAADGREIRSDRIKALPNGTLEYLSPDGKRTERLARGRYRYAYVPKPPSVAEADLKFTEQQWSSAAVLYRKAGTEYKWLGWEPYCVRMAADALTRAGEKAQALEALRTLHGSGEASPHTAHDRALADNLLAKLLIEAGQYEEAQKILDAQARLDDPELVFEAYFQSAAVLHDLGKRRDAARLFYQTALLFPQNARRPDALYYAWSLLAELKDPNADKLAEMLKREYPDHSLTQRVFR